MSNYNNNNYNNNNNKKKGSPLLAILKVLGVVGAATVSAVATAETKHRVSENNTREKAMKALLDENNSGGE